VVIGSGPAGVAAAHALCESGLDSVTVLDAGDTIEAGRMEPFEVLARLEPGDWPADLARSVHSSYPVDIKHVPLKPLYGSLFPYVVDDLDLAITRKNAETLTSLAYGGLSNTWGAAMLPMRQADIEDWPISLADLKPHYEAVQRFVPVAAARDELSEALPLYTQTPGALRRGPQAEMLLSHLRRHAPALSAAGFTFGASRLAVVASPGDPRSCRHCGLCLVGCPYGSIYNAAYTVHALARDGKVDYRGGLYVDRISEAGDSVTIEFHARGNAAETGRLTAARVFIACGAISSTRLVLASMGRVGCARRLKDSQYFMIPMVTARSAPVSVATQGNTLAQVFLELEDARICEHAAHLQVYGYNDIMLAALAKRVPLKAARLERMLRPLLTRLVLVQGFLHSADSPGLELACDAARVSIVGDDTAVAAMRVKRLVRRLVANGRLLGMLPLPGLVHVGTPGKSNHLGGSLPMRHVPGELETDTLGRLASWDRVHVVDSSVFPSVPATTVTLSVMANAHRIASGAAKIDP
jgi:choline dehydrogenase-like flavoprotein